MNWYDENIEEGIRDVVKLLRDNGFNTTCSCEHKMYVEGNLIVDGDLKRMHDLIWNFLHENNIPINFEIDINHKVVDGWIVWTRFEIKIQKN